jgi:hypothetical protein
MAVEAPSSASSMIKILILGIPYIIIGCKGTQISNKYPNIVIPKIWYYGYFFVILQPNYHNHVRNEAFSSMFTVVHGLGGLECPRGFDNGS